MSKPTPNKNEILEDFKLKRELFKKFSTKVEGLIAELLIDKSVSVHQIAVRVKEYDSLSKKLDKKAGKYGSLNEITDIVGVRIIVYLENEVDLVADVINKEFIIDLENSVDRRKLAVDSFGYKSLHYVLSLNEQRCKLTEYKRFKGLKAEIQIRSVLQHAWAEIEHDLGYKGANEIPEQHKRTFYRIAAQLETADLEFVRLKQDLDAYEKELPREIEERPEEVLIDRASFKSYIETSPVVNSIDKNISTAVNVDIKSTSDNLEFLLSKYAFFGIETIKQLDDLLVINEKKIIAFAKFFFSGTLSLPKGISIFYLYYVLLMNDSRKEYIKEYLKYGEKLIGGEDFADELFREFENFKQGKKRGDT